MQMLEVQQNGYVFDLVSGERIVPECNFGMPQACREIDF